MIKVTQGIPTCILSIFYLRSIIIFRGKALHKGLFSVSISMRYSPLL